jgi:hypothetical protein
MSKQLSVKELTKSNSRNIISFEVKKEICKLKEMKLIIGQENELTPLRINNFNNN